MKKNIHPNYRSVLFEDITNGSKLLLKSTIMTNDTIEYDGEKYPLVKIEVSSKSHPFYTGKKMSLENVGQIEKFRKRYAKLK